MAHVEGMPANDPRQTYPSLLAGADAPTTGCMSVKRHGRALPKMDFLLQRTKLWSLALAACLMIPCMGCGTIVTRFASPNWKPPEPTLPRIYSGTIFDFTCFLYPKMHETQGMGGFCLVDVPFSIIGDTVILPLTIYEQVKYGSYAAVKPMDGKKGPE